MAGADLTIITDHPNDPPTTISVGVGPMSDCLSDAIEIEIGTGLFFTPVAPIKAPAVHRADADA